MLTFVAMSDRLASDQAAAELIEQAPPVRIFTMLGRFWPYCRSRRAVLAFVLVLSVVQPALDVAEIWLFKLLVDNVLVPESFSGFPPIAAAYIVLTLLGGFVSYVDDVLSEWLSQRFLTDLRADVFRHMQGLSMDFFENRRIGDLISRLTGDVTAIETFLVSGLRDGTSYALRLVAYTVAIFLIQWQLALVSFLVVPLLWLVSRHFARLIKIASRERRRRAGSLSVVAEEALSNAVLVQGYNRQQWEIERFQRQAEAKYHAEMAATRLRALFTPLAETTELMGALAVIGLGTWQLSNDQLSIGGLLVFLTFLAGLYVPVRGLSRITASAYSASAGAERVIELLEQAPGVQQSRFPRTLVHPKGHVYFDAVSFRYPSRGDWALDRVTLSIPPGRTLALVGASGAGKSTLAKLLMRFYDPDIGRILLDSVDIRDLDLSCLRGNIAAVLQETLVFDGTIRDNIAYGKLGATDTDIVAAARSADAHQFITALPDGYDTRIGERGRRLSGGQRQRIAIARAMIRDAAVLILDEPTTGLDAESAYRLTAPMRRLMVGRSTILISHSLLITRDAAEIVVLSQGGITERGTHDELLRRNGTYCELWRHAAFDGPRKAETGDRR
ncbi:ABC transporter ATP-binding protein [Frankia sp. Cppng1_Ct_nod]|uniref:ABC transporter ATP-binding protein n=1 Tax=Frankia sp. Cppng1_Ct_nod TaxID=2897162 RepID=UPI0020247735|nr:ABC transporter ATP-binding protein [Frankia sp. Cppng1_Ct_nod]